ncbi:MAG: type III secretion system gatekeeper subunit SctW [Verrucomicrobia bacterium]|nr:type III secretion system gatekeeper subunit SctW [Verrucomicrobiota bacterium]
MAELPGFDPTQQAIQAEMKAETSFVQEAFARQISSNRAFTEEAEEAFNPFAADKETEFKALKHRAREVTKEEADEEIQQLIVQRKEQAAEDLADQMHENNHELDRYRLLEMRTYVLAKASSSSPEEMIEDIRSFFNDPSLADEALDYLLQTCDPALKEKILAAKELLQQQLGREVKAGRNIGPQSREFAEAGLAQPGFLRDLYRDITGNPREQNALFEELARQFPFEKLKQVIKFLLQSLGADLRSKGPSIARGELYRLTTEARVLQSILGVYHFFKRRERLIRKLLTQEGIKVPAKVQFELLAKAFIALVEERYPTPIKVLQLAKNFDVSENLVAQTIVFSQFRDAIREVAPRIYRSLQHRYDMLQALLEALEELEEKLDEEYEEENQ